MVPLARIGLATPSLPMTCSTTELQRRQLKENIQSIKIKIKHIFSLFIIFFIHSFQSINFSAKIKKRIMIKSIFTKRVSI